MALGDGGSHTKETGLPSCCRLLVQSLLHPSLVFACKLLHSEARSRALRFEQAKSHARSSPPAPLSQRRAQQRLGAGCVCRV